MMTMVYVLGRRRALLPLELACQRRRRRCM
jgi:hypothetical protein